MKKSQILAISAIVSLFFLISFAFAGGKTPRPKKGTAVINSADTTYVVRQSDSAALIGLAPDGFRVKVVPK